MRAGLKRFEAWAEDTLRRAERHDPEALHWCGFFTLTALSFLVLVLVGTLVLVYG
jgi:hypothetical protein